MKNSFVPTVPDVSAVSYLQGGAVFREGGAEEGIDGVQHHIHNVLLQDRIR